MKRRDLIGSLAALGAAGFAARITEALAAGDVPPSLHKLDGTATINGRQARAGAQVSLGDRVATGRDSQAVVVLKGDAFLMRSDTIIEVKGREGILSDLTVATGRVLSVFAKKPLAVKAAHASIGIRGTGFYLEVEPKSVYFCLCYGEADVDGAGMATKRVKTTHHEEPLILQEEGGVMRAVPGPFRNHSDAELIMLEALVGREPPFVKDGQYPAKKY